MPSASLVLRSLINKPEMLDPDVEFTTLDDNDPPTLFIYGESLAMRILKNNAFATYNLIDHWKTITRQTSLPTLEKLFSKTPFFLHGDVHRQTRRSLGQPYRLVESQFQDWLPTFSANFFKQMTTLKPMKPNELASRFVSEVSGQILAHAFQVNPASIPQMSVPTQSLFRFFPSPKKILDFEDKLTQVANFLLDLSIQQNRDPEEIWAYLSIIVMGQEPLYGSLTYALSHPLKHGPLNAQILLQETAPVTLLGRQAMQDIILCDIEFKKGQALHIAPFIINNKLLSEQCPIKASQAMEFGAGVHLCSGRKITLEITNAFITALHKHPETLPQQTNIKFVRDFILVPKEIH